MRTLASLLAFAIYITGIVLAKGFWWTFGAIVLPPISWYIAIEHFVRHFNLL
ncbi:hypothetical protein vBAbaMPhT2_015 [Acinetobacter phage vB_AbaM_PhT2]|uniref:Uncharacterized protein n=2 Tax=Hadassahvirus TaxID=2842716 RepID=A0A6B9SXI4_9CAUD|nr:hypothetical protein HYP74_gp029 [Acinetobacter phage AbTZA1]YP_009887035.1 hypothetical protein HYQ24_gp015 [Acinetobacter phage vB_AbaM_PhT2]QQM13803.1 hypothetical protein CPT_Maestro_069 [Acinetobacter phage Maestro]QQM18559.1 hypothetical protein CPT_Morttis_066 [Acinetobacter phage Morttis]QQO96266.1 hypothetical protein CPT_Minot_063 [Acinetobacter phage Minot]QQO96514.1 hypothetical protein CPT_Mokit_063 [Acinetobacter phage Mokit]UQS94142.1 hypothetical protein ABNavy71_065 [Acine